MPKKLYAFREISLVQAESICYNGTIYDAEDVVDFFKVKISRSTQERLLGIYLDTRNTPLGWYEISRGTVSASLVHPREVFIPAVKLSASSVVVAHNHPSGVCKPSEEDKRITHRLIKAGSVLGIPLVDHVIVTPKGYYSFRRNFGDLFADDPSDLLR